LKPIDYIHLVSEKLGIYEFNLMPIDMQAETLWDKGVFLTNLIIGKMRCNLYSLSNFYVEVEYGKEENEILEFRTFKRGKRLEKYIDQVELDDLL